MTTFDARVHALARAIPPGRVTTYGAIARALGPAVGPREVGRTLARLPAGHDVPTHRVVSTEGRPLCPRGRDLREQHRALEAEGVALDDRGRVSLEQHLWAPEPL